MRVAVKPGGFSVVSPQAPRGFRVCYHGFPAFLARSTSVKTAKLSSLMQMRKLVCSPSLAYDSAHVKYGV